VSSVGQCNEILVSENLMLERREHSTPEIFSISFLFFFFLDFIYSQLHENCYKSFLLSSPYVGFFFSCDFHITHWTVALELALA